MDLEEKTEMIKYCPVCEKIRGFYKKEESDMYVCSECRNSFNRSRILSYDSRKRLINYRNGFK